MHNTGEFVLQEDSKSWIRIVDQWLYIWSFFTKKDKDNSEEKNSLNYMNMVVISDVNNSNLKGNTSYKNPWWLTWSSVDSRATTLDMTWYGFPSVTSHTLLNSSKLHWSGKPTEIHLNFQHKKIKERVTKKHKTFTCNILAVYQVSALFNAQIT